jgi:hypothetical protein
VWCWSPERIGETTVFSFFARTFVRGAVVTPILDMLIAAQQYLAPWIIPEIAVPRRRAGRTFE